MAYGGSWAPGQSVGGPWTISGDSAGTASDDGLGSGLDLGLSGGGRELATAGQSLSDLDMIVSLASVSQGDGLDSVEVLWHVTALDSYMEFTVGSAGWQIVAVDSGVANVLRSGPDSVPAGGGAAIEVASSGGITTVSLGPTALSSVFDGGSGDVGVASANGSETTFQAVALST